jgi:hypothetical protein
MRRSKSSSAKPAPGAVERRKVPDRRGGVDRRELPPRPEGRRMTGGRRKGDPRDP